MENYKRPLGIAAGGHAMTEAMLAAFYDRLGEARDGRRAAHGRLIASGL